MSLVVQPILFAALVWWLSTGAILWLIGLPARTHKWTALGATAMLVGATVTMLQLRQETGVMAAYAGFATGILLWAWHEVMFLLGFITGPSKQACPSGLGQGRRFLAAAGVVLHHEVLLALHAGIIVLLSWDAPNQYAAWTFMVLWGMRLSSKLVVFTGAPNIVDKFLPERLDYLKTYFSRQSPGSLFGVAIIAVTAVAAILYWQALGHEPGTFHSAGFYLLAAITTLAVLEHWALVLPMPDPLFWEWALKPSRQNRRVKTRTKNWRG